MSPDLVFFLSLALRMAISAALVITAAMITERSGPVIGALVATLPISAGPSYVFLAIDHDAAFIATSALASLPINAATIFAGLAYVLVTQRYGVKGGAPAALAVWVGAALLVRTFHWNLTAGIIANLASFAICLPLAQRYRTVKMPLITRRWYDIPLRAALVSGLIGTVVTLSGWVGPTVSGIIALFPVVFTSLIIALHRRIGQQATAALVANGLWGLAGFGVAIVVLHLTASHFGSAAGLSLALATSAGWNIGMWLHGHHRRAA